MLLSNKYYILPISCSSDIDWVDFSKMINSVKINELKKYVTDSLYRNAFFLTVANVITALFGFVFWLVAAHFYSVAEVGLVAALVSSVSLLSSIAKIGFDVGLVRYLPQSQDKKTIINSSFSVTALISTIAAIIFIMGVGFWSPKLLFIRENILYFFVFVAFTVLTTINQLQWQVFVAFRAAHFALLESLINGLEPVAVVLLAFAGIWGIFLSANLGLVLASLVGVFFIIKLVPGYIPMPKITKSVGVEIVRFSLINYAVGVLVALPQYLFTLIIIAVLTAADSAYFYIAFSLSGIIGLVAAVSSLTLLAEGSYDPENLRSQIIKAFKFTLLLALPFVIILLILGNAILTLYGTQYSDNSLWLLRFLSIGWLPNIVSAIYTSVLRVQKRGGSAYLNMGILCNFYCDYQLLHD